MSNKKLWNKLAAVTVVSAMILAAAGCGTTQTGAMTQDQVEDAAGKMLADTAVCVRQFRGLPGR